MNAVVSRVTGKDKKRDAQNRAAQAAQEAEQQRKKLLKERDEAARLAGEKQSAARRARMGGRGLLSDTRLNPEQGVQSTLGSAP